MKYTRKSRPQQNQLAELGFPDKAGKSRAMMQADGPKEIKYKLCMKCFNCTTYLSTLLMMSYSKMGTRYKHSHEAKPSVADEAAISSCTHPLSMHKDQYY